MKSLNQNLAAINFWCCKWHMKLSSKKTKSMVVSRSLTNALSYCDLTFGGAELEELNSLRILRVILDSKLTFETYLVKLFQWQPGVWVSCAKEARYLIIHVCSRAVSMHMFCSAWSIVPRADVVYGVSFGVAG